MATFPFFFSEAVGSPTFPDLSSTFVGEYKYTVNVGDQKIRIYGSNANLVRVNFLNL